MQVKNYKEHYKIDAELFDYFEDLGKIDLDLNKRLHQAIKSLNNKKNSKILDVGSGNGWSLKFFSKIFLVDISQENLKKISNSDNSNIFLNADVNQMPVKNDSFDFIILSEVLEHLNDPAKSIKELYRLLNKGGVLAISTPYNENIKKYLCIHCNKVTPANAHLHSFNENNLNDALFSLNIKNFNFYKLGNKLFIQMRLSYILSFLPFKLWKLFDNLINFIYNRPLFIITLIKK